MKRIVGVTYENDACVGITVDGILDNNTNPNELVNFERVRHGYWITYAYDKRECYCSNCEFPAGLDAYGYHNMQDPYCRFCGAKMDEVIE